MKTQWAHATTDIRLCASVNAQVTLYTRIKTNLMHLYQINLSFLLKVA